MPTPSLSVGNPNLEKLLQYLLLGAGTYGATRLYSNVAAQDQLENEPGKDKSTLTIDLPENLNPYLKPPQKIGSEKTGGVWDWLPDVPKDLFNRAANFAVPPLAFGGGFMGAKYLYDNYKKNQIEAEIEKAKQEYMKTLASFKQAAEKMDTPLTDAFCEGIKIANFPNDPRELAAQNEANANVLVPGANKSPLSWLWDNSVTGNFFKAGTGISALVTSLLLLRADQQRKAKEQKRILPSSVEINYMPANQAPPKL